MPSAVRSPAAKVGPARVAGTHILDQMEILRELHGEAPLRRALESLPEDLKHELETLTRGGWCSVDAARVYKAAVAGIVEEEPLALQRRVVRAGIERTFGSVWRSLLGLLSDGRLARAAPMIYGRTFDRGQLALTDMFPGGCLLTQSGWPEIDEFDLTGLVSGIEAALGVAGRKQVRGEWRRVDNLVEIRVSWR